MQKGPTPSVSVTLKTGKGSAANATLVPNAKNALGPVAFQNRLNIRFYLEPLMKKNLKKEVPAEEPKDFWVRALISINTGVWAVVLTGLTVTAFVFACGLAVVIAAITFPIVSFLVGG